jgi:hypothetical protein
MCMIILRYTIRLYGNSRSTVQVQNRILCQGYLYTNQHRSPLPIRSFDYLVLHHRQDQGKFDHTGFLRPAVEAEGDKLLRPFEAQRVPGTGATRPHTAQLLSVDGDVPVRIRGIQAICTSTVCTNECKNSVVACII